MAVTSTTQTANLGNGVMVSNAMFGATRALSIIPRMVGAVPRSRGAAGYTWVRLGAAIAAAAFAESSAAATATTLPTVTQVTASPVGYVSTVGATDEAELRAVEGNSPMAILKEEALFASKQYIAADASVGLAYQFTQVSASGGVSGGTLTKSSIRSAARTIWDAVGNNIHLFLVISEKGWQDLVNEAEASGSSYLSSEALVPELRAMFAADGIDLNANGYRTSFDRIHVFVESKASNLITVGGDVTGCLFVPAAPALNGFASIHEQQKSLMPAFGIVYDENPMILSGDTVQGGPERVEHDCGVSMVAQRSFAGQRQAVVDVFGAGATAILNQSAAVKILYLA